MVSRKLRYFGLILFMAVLFFNVEAQTVRIPQIGIVQKLEHDSLVAAQGFTALVESTQRLLSPRNVTDSDFAQHAEVLAQLKTPVIACNLFLPGDLKVVGESVDEQAVLSYVEVVFARAGAAGLKMIIWGSGGSRSVPPGYDYDKARAQFIMMAGKIAAVAAKYNIVLAVESLNTSECNFLTTVREVGQVAKAVNHPNLRVCVDLYHMARENEPPSVIREVKDYIVYCEVAEKEARTPPGVKGDDLRPYFRELARIRYRGYVVIECRWENVAAQGANAFAYLKSQLTDAYRSR